MTSPALLTVQIEVDPAHEADLNRWYDEEHIPQRLAMPGFLAARRYRLHDGSPSYLAVYELADPLAATSEEYMNQPPTDWMRRLRPHWRSLHRAVWTALPDLSAPAGSASGPGTPGPEATDPRPARREPTRQRRRS